MAGYHSHYEISEDSQFVRTDLIENLERRSSTTVQHMDTFPDSDDVPGFVVVIPDGDEPEIDDEVDGEVDVNEESTEAVS